jgi:hypothetical protein
MKLFLSILVSAVVSISATRMSAPAEFASMDAASKAAENLLLSPRQLEDAAADMVGSHSIIYDGCHNTTSWAEGVYSVVPLIRFRLCPSKYVHSGRCFSSRVGEYLVEMATFVDSYMEYQLEITRQNCEVSKKSQYYTVFVEVGARIVPFPINERSHFVIISTEHA